ncbi:MAG: hypothetical protein AAB214_13915, partial [Fibrobacterota bacterium]
MLDRSLIPRARLAFRHLSLAIPVAAAALFSGCGLDPQAGGGTELPGPIRVYVFVDSSASPHDPQIASRILASQWRLWDVRSQTTASTTLASR